MSLLILSFNILNDNINCNGVNGNFILGIFDIKSENYDSLEYSLSVPLREILYYVNKISIDE